MFKDGLIYSDSRMSEKREFTDTLTRHKIDDTETRWKKGGPILFSENGEVFVDDSEAHTLTIGDTGSTKTLRFVLPNIYSCAMAGESMVVIDPKGELVKKAHPFVKDRGYKTIIINLRTPQTSPDRWNPMARIQRMLDSDSAYDKEMAFILLNDLLNRLFYTRSVADKEIFWNESAGQLALGLYGMMEKAGDRLTIKNLLKWRYEHLVDGTVDSLYRALPSNSTTYQNLSGYMSLTAENTRTCILSTFDQLIRIFKSSPALTDMLSESTFELDEIGTEKVAVFIVVPDEKTTFHFLAILFICQYYEWLLEQAEEFGGVLPHRVNFFLEEFCNMPMLEDIIPMLTAARSRNIRFHLVIQSYEQMAQKYGEHSSKTILDNCGNLIYLHSRELSFLKYISDLSGVNEYGRPVLSVSRLQRLKKNETIIFHDRCYPFLVQNVPLIFDYPVQLGTKIPVREIKPSGKAQLQRAIHSVRKIHI